MIREAVVAHISLSLAEGERQLQQLAYSINARNCSVAVFTLGWISEKLAMEGGSTLFMLRCCKGVIPKRYFISSSFPTRTWNDERNSHITSKSNLGEDK